MPKITNFDRKSLNDLRQELTEALGDVTRATGVVFTLDVIRFDSQSFRVQLSGIPHRTDGDGNALTPEQVAWNKEAKWFGLDPAWLGRTVRWSGKDATIVGLLPNRRKYPVVVDRGGNKRRGLLTVESVRRQLGAPAPGIPNSNALVAAANALRNGK